jgi:phosphatidylserine/phosphatidylglycerophosphate/cardiolipin synthase-like enzyme
MSDPKPVPVAPFDAIPAIPEIPPIPKIPPVDAPAPEPPVRRTDTPAETLAFFLPPKDDSDPMVFRGAVRDVVKVTPIIDGKDIFIALETAIKNATSSVLLAFWSFDPDTKLVTDSSRNWITLLKETAKRGVLVRLMMTDFDPGFSFRNHSDTWKRYQAILFATGTAPTDKFQIVCNHHETEASSLLVGQLTKHQLYAAVADAVNAEPDPKKTFLAAPGLWDKLDFIGTTAKEKTKDKDYNAWPAVHHQKLVIVDGTYAFTGGVNVTDEYPDTRQHDTPLLWHDAFVKVEGQQVLKDFVRAYIGFWNQERVRAEAFLNNAYTALNDPTVPKRIGKTTELKDADVRVPLTSTTPPKISAQVHRTITKNGLNPMGIPDIVRQDILEGYLQAIGQAEKFIYFENQYFREKAIADAIVKRHKVSKNLNVIILVPKVAEEIDKAKGGVVDPVTDHGARLQFDLFKELAKELKTNFGLFAMIRKDKQAVYTHSKLFIIDDKFASIGSANANPRSFRMDTELDFTWHNAGVTEKLRLDLWNEILGNPSTIGSWKPKDFVSKWTAIATKNDRGSSSARKGFVTVFKNTYKGKLAPVDLSPFT